MPVISSKKTKTRKRLKDIRRHMISNDLTDPNKFDNSEHQPYPKIVKHSKDHKDPKLAGKTFKDDDDNIYKVYNREEELEICKRFGLTPSEEKSEEIEENDGDQDEDEAPKKASKKKGK